MKKVNVIKIRKINLSRQYDPEILSVAGASVGAFSTHKEIAQKLKDKSPYIITVIINCLNPRFWNNKKYVEKIKIPIDPLYKELLYKYFFDKFGDKEGNELYAKWLDRYRAKLLKEKMSKNLDGYIIENELEPRYKEKILKKHKDYESLFKPRSRIERKRYYNLPQPLNHIDWRNPYDNIFIWEEKGKKFFRKGGSGSSGGRETNSKFIFGFSLINQIKPIPSYLFLYGDDNQLYFIKRFSSLTVPRYDIGSNYTIKRSEEEKIFSKTNFIAWKDFIRAKEIKIKLNNKS